MSDQLYQGELGELLKIAAVVKGMFAMPEALQACGYSTEQIEAVVVGMAHWIAEDPKEVLP